MSDVAYITNAAATLTFTAESKTVTVTGTNPILEGVLRGDRAVDPNGVELAIDVVAAGTLTLLRNAPTSGTVQFDIAPVSRLRTSLAANAEVTREVYAKLLAAVEDNRSIPVISQATAPPGSPADGDRHLVIATATGVFAGKEGYIAQYDAANTRWIFIAPIAGMKVTVDGSAVLRIYTGAAWTVSGATAASEIAFTPTGGVAATTVQAAIAEVDSEKVTKASGTTVGRLWRFTDTAGGLGQSQMLEDGSGNIVTGGSVTVGATGSEGHHVLNKGALDATHRMFVAGGATGWASGLNLPGGSAGTTWTLSKYASSAWTQMMSITAAGVLTFGTPASVGHITLVSGAASSYQTFHPAGAATGFAVGLSRPGDSIGTALVWSSLASGTWTARAALTAVGDFGVGTQTPNKLSLEKAFTVNGATAASYSGFEIATADAARGGFFANNADVRIQAQGSLPLYFVQNSGVQFWIGSGAITANLPMTTTAMAHRQSALTLASTDNHNAARPDSSSLRVGGPGVNFTISGLTGGTDGLLCELINTTAFTMTLTNENASSTAGNRISTDTGGNITCKVATLRYDATASRWRVISFRT